MAASRRSPSRAARRRRRAVRARPAASPAAVYAARLLERGQSDPVRHGRHQHRHLAGRRRRAEPSPDRRRRRPSRRAATASTSPASAPAAARSRASMPAASCMSGPQSAGADPGPACYGSGGTAATVTDANLVLGYLDPANFLGGRRRLDRRGRRGARSTLSPAALGIDRMAAAAASTASSTRRWPRASGSSPCAAASIRGTSRCSPSAAPPGLHATEIARQLDLARVIVPRVAAVLSAWGMLATDLRFEVARTHIGDTRALDGGAVAPVRGDGGRGARAAARRRSTGRSARSASVDMRYGEQIFEITVPLDGVDWAAADPLPQIVDALSPPPRGALHLLAARSGDRAGERARSGRRPCCSALPQEPDLPAGRPRRPAASGGSISTAGSLAGLRSRALAPGKRSPGPAIVESPMTTVLLRPGERPRLRRSAGSTSTAAPLRPRH